MDNNYKNLEIILLYIAPHPSSHLWCIQSLLWWVFVLLCGLLVLSLAMDLGKMRGGKGVSPEMQLIHP